MAPLPTVDVGAVELIFGLIPFSACDELLRYLQDEASARVGPYGLDGGWYGPVMPFAVRAVGGPVPEIAMAFDDSMGAAPTPGVDFSETNVQEAGIDEPDLVKTDGVRIVVVEGGWLHVIDPSSDSPTPVGRLALTGHWGGELLLSGDRAWVLADTDAYYEEGSMPMVPAVARILPPGRWRPLTSIIEVDLADPTNPTVVGTLTVEGRYVSARVVNGAARVVVSSAPDDLPFVMPQTPAAEDRAERVNRQVVAETTVEDWMPSFVFEAGDGSLVNGWLVDCDRVSHPVVFAGFSTLSVLTVDLSSPLSVPGATAVLADGETVYAGHQNLYVATTKYPEPVPFDDEAAWLRMDDDYATSIHQFRVTDPSTTEYLASATVPGHLLNQFSMSELDSHLRVATTSGAPWGFDEEAESAITVLARDGFELVEVGRVGNMGRGERIHAVRFLGDTAFVVTFRRTDPFYVVDLSDPTVPTVRGELKITGYSGYLHPVGGDLILGIGQEATEEGMTTGAKATLFDVSDPADPMELDTWSSGGGSSAVEWDHRAFLWWPPEYLAVMPFTDWSDDRAEAVLLRVAEGAVSEAGRVSHTTGPVDDRQGLLCPVPYPDGATDTDFEDSGVEIAALACAPEPWVPLRRIERTMIVGDDLWSYSWGRLQANDLGSLATLRVVDLITEEG
ncbi:MAG: beta-propeller domain-containing protein [Actinomycetota bacterium]|nr:beta-propeller domain-containing protein [Actinomycetota bacterium]